MTFKPVSVNAIDIKKEINVPYVGTYTGKQGITTKVGPQTIYRFIDEDEQIFGIYGFSNLDRAMNSVLENKLCRITYLGTKNVMTKYGMRDVHQVLVETDDGEDDKKEIPF